MEEVQEVLEQHLIADTAATGAQPATTENEPASATN
jgi:hypothetical protein